MALVTMSGTVGAVLVLAQLAREGEAVHARHQQIADDQVERALVERGEPVLAVDGGDDLGRARCQRRLVREELLEDLADVLVVLDDQDAQGHGACNFITKRRQARELAGEMTRRAMSWRSLPSSGGAVVRQISGRSFFA